MKLPRNMSDLDRAVRATVGVSLFYLGPLSDVLTADPMSDLLLAGVGALALVSAATGYCPLYQVCGFCTYRPRRRGE